MTIHYSSSTLGFYDDTIVNSSLIPTGAIVVPDATYAELMAAVAAGQIIGSDSNGNPVALAPVVTTPTQAQIEMQYAKALTTAIDTVAQSWQYDNIYTAATYLTSAIPQFQNEAKALVAWRDTAWSNAQALLAQVTAGTATMPATSAAFLALVLPTAPTRPTA